MNRVPFLLEQDKVSWNLNLFLLWYRNMQAIIDMMHARREPAEMMAIAPAVEINDEELCEAKLVPRGRGGGGGGGCDVITGDSAE